MSRDDAMGRPPAGVGEEALKAIDEALRGLPPVPAPSATVRRTLERVERARQRTPGRALGWIMVAAASLVAVVGAWLSVRGGAADAPRTDSLARYDVDAHANEARGRYRLRGVAEISEQEKSEELDESSVDGSRDAGRGPDEMGFLGQEIDIGGRESDFIPKVTVAKPIGGDVEGERLANQADKVAGNLRDSLAMDAKDNGVAPAIPDPSAVVLTDGEETRNAPAADTSKLQIVTAPKSGEVTVDGQPWSTVTLSGTNVQGDDDANERAQGLGPKRPAGSAAPVASPTPVVATGQTEAAAPVTSTTVEDGRFQLDLQQPGYRYKAPVVTRLPAQPLDTTVATAETCDGLDQDCDGALHVDLVRGVTGEGDGDFRAQGGEATSGKVTKADAATAAAERHGDLFWDLPPEDVDGWADEDEEIPVAGPTAVADAGQRGEKTENKEGKGKDLLAGLGGKRAIPERTLVPPAGAIEGLTGLPTQGYYKNTYLPGDPETRWLRASLADRLTRDGVDLALERAARPPVQPFAAPAGQGLGLAVTADRLAVAGPTRMTVQIGLAGADRAASRRAPLNLALVLDVASITDEAERQALWSLADALAASRRPGDRFAIVVTGGGGDDGLLVSNDAMSGPEVRRALASAFETRSGAGDLDGALARAVAEVRAGARADAPLGAELVVVASSRTLAADARVKMEERARQAALGGVHVTAVGVGARPDGVGLRGLAEAGQGRRLLVSDSEGARAAMVKELAASGRAVARAVRLRIRLSEGVKLVGVLGSAPLGEVDAERVRVAEKAIDRQVRDATGIASDRGEDEDGIQIVIPAFYAGDRHVILLDVVASGPGQVVDVRARFKDLVALGNGEASASLSLGDHPEDAPVSPATRNVVANRAAYSIGEALLDASRALDAGDRGQAFAALAGARAGLSSLEVADPGLEPVLAADRAMLAQYVALLGDAGAWGGDPTLVAWVSRSLRLAARIKGLP